MVIVMIVNRIIIIIIIMIIILMLVIKTMVIMIIIITVTQTTISSNLIGSFSTLAVLKGPGTYFVATQPLTINLIGGSVKSTREF